MADASLATSADYADAMLVARRAKNWLFLFLLLMLLLQMTFFFVARYTRVLDTVAPATPAPPSVSTTIDLGGATTGPAAAGATTLPAAPVAANVRVHRSAGAEMLRYLSGLTLFLGTVLPILLALVLLLIVNIMLIGRLIGVSRVTSAFIWCLLLMLLMFPWQVFFGATYSPKDFRVPGVLYTWNDLSTNAHFDARDVNVAVVKWARFFVMPLVATVILLAIQIKSNRGLREALGEAPAVPVGGPAPGSDLNITV